MSFIKACVVGAGTMGHGIAYVLARAGFLVELIDHSKMALDNAMEQLKSITDEAVMRNKLSPYEAEKILSSIALSPSIDALHDADLMIEAINEDIEHKQKLFMHADALVKEDALLASNTSSLSITDIAENVLNKERVIGLHFFNPPHTTKLLEIVVHEKTSIEALSSAKELALMLRKECIVVNDSPGFATSRLGICMSLEAIRMLEQRVAGVLEIDSAMKLGYGHPMGPLMLSDWVGLDLRLAISEMLFKELDSAVFAPPDLLRRMVRAGFLGKKSGTGFYEWDNNRHLGISQTLIERLF